MERTPTTPRAVVRAPAKGTLRLGDTTESKDFSEIVAKVGNQEIKQKFGCRNRTRGSVFFVFLLFAAAHKIPP